MSCTLRSHANRLAPCRAWTAGHPAPHNPKAGGPPSLGTGAGAAHMFVVSQCVRFDLHQLQAAARGRITDSWDIDSCRASFHSGIDEIPPSPRRKSVMKTLERVCLDSPGSRDRIYSQSHCRVRLLHADEYTAHNHRHNDLELPKIVWLIRPCHDKRGGHIRVPRKCDR